MKGRMDNPDQLAVRCSATLRDWADAANAGSYACVGYAGHTGDHTAVPARGGVVTWQDPTDSHTELNVPADSLTPRRARILRVMVDHVPLAPLELDATVTIELGDGAPHTLTITYGMD